MNIKLIYPPSINSRERNCLYPLSLASLAGALKGMPVHIEQWDISLDIFKSQMYFEEALFRSSESILGELANDKNAELLNELAEDLLRGFPYSETDLVGISITGRNNLIPALIVSRQIKKVSNATVVFGGPSMGWMYEELLEKFRFVDYCVCGEGELPFVMLVQYLSGERMRLSDIPGLAYKNRKRITGNQPWVSDVSLLPIPEYDENIVAGYANSYNVLFGKKYRLLPYEISKGCTNTCNFCAASSPLRKKNLKKIVRDISHIRRAHDNEWFFFADNAINQSEAYLETVCDSFRSKDLRFSWFSCAHPYFKNKKLPVTMFKSGCRLLYFGV